MLNFMDVHATTLNTVEVAQQRQFQNKLIMKNCNFSSSNFFKQQIFNFMIYHKFIGNLCISNDHFLSLLEKQLLENMIYIFSMGD